jgi:thiol-activated cytolysin
VVPKKLLHFLCNLTPNFRLYILTTTKHAINNSPSTKVKIMKQLTNEMLGQQTKTASFSKISPERKLARTSKISAGLTGTARSNKPLFEFQTQPPNSKAKNTIRGSICRNLKEQIKIVPKAPATPDADNGKPGNNFVCSQTTYSADVNSPDTVMLNSNFDAIYPGAIFKLEDIVNGSYKPILYSRKPIRISSDNHSFRKDNILIEHPDRKSSINQAIADMKGSQMRPPAVQQSYGQSFEVLSEEDLFVRTGGSGNYLCFGGSADFSFGEQQKSHKYFVEVYQKFYSISVDPLNDPSEFFILAEEKKNDPNAIPRNKIDKDWAYVDTVTYGRILHIMYESDDDLKSIGLDVEAHADFGVAGGEASFSFRQKTALQNTKVTVSTIGGKPIYAGQLSSASDLHKSIDNFFKGTNDEAMIAFTLRTLDNDMLGVKLSSDFTSRQCTPAASKYKISWESVSIPTKKTDTDNYRIQASVRIRALDNHGKDILDEHKVNESLLEVIRMNRLTHNAVTLPEPWTFQSGNSEYPLNVSSNDINGHAINKELIFPFPLDNKNCKIDIRTAVKKFNSFPSGDDNFTDDTQNKDLSSIGSKETLTCTHDEKRVAFN